LRVSLFQKYVSQAKNPNIPGKERLRLGILAPLLIFESINSPDKLDFQFIHLIFPFCNYSHIGTKGRQMVLAMANSFLH
jgi:hypothetical protein